MFPFNARSNTFKIDVTAHKIFKDEIEKDIKSLSDSWKYYGLPALAYNGLLLSGKLGQGFDNKIKTAP